MLRLTGKNVEDAPLPLPLSLRCERNGFDGALELNRISEVFFLGSVVASLSSQLASSTSTCMLYVCILPVPQILSHKIDRFSQIISNLHKIEKSIVCFSILLLNLKLWINPSFSKTSTRVMLECSLHCSLCYVVSFVSIALPCHHSTVHVTMSHDTFCHYKHKRQLFY